MSKPERVVESAVAAGRRYVGVAVIPKRRKQIERILGRVVELGGEALLITADGSAHAAYPGVEHIDLLRREMRLPGNRIIAVSPKRLAGKLVGKSVGGRSLLWRRWVKAKPYKVVRFHALWHALKPDIAQVRPMDVTDVILAGVESWPITWHITRVNPEVRVAWDLPDSWKTPMP